MASNTPRLNLYKKDPVADANTTFNITTMLNDNWDRIDQNVALQADLHTHANKAVLDKFSEGADGKPLYNGQKITDETTVQALQKEIANLNLQLEASQRVPNGYTFGTDGVNIFGMNIDFTKTTAVGALSAGTTNIPVQDVTGFKAGQEVTIYDDTNIERVTISGIDPDNKILSVSALTKSYKDGANIARTMAVADSFNKCLKFGGWGTLTTNTITDATVVASAYDTSGNGGRKLVRLDDGRFVAIALGSDRNTYLYLIQSNGASSQLCYVSDRTGTGSIFSSVVYLGGTRVGLIVTRTYTSSGNYSGISFFSVDVDTVTNTDIYNSGIQIENYQVSFSGVSLAINSAGTELHAAWASKNSTYGNSYNIRYVKGTINADGSVTWGAVQQITTWNTSGSYAQNPSIVIKDNVPIIFTEWYNGSTYYIFALKQSGLSTSADSYCTWTRQAVYSVGSYTQSSPSACVDKNGRIWVAWYGKDSTDTDVWNIRVAYSDDGGVTWSGMQKLTSGNSYSQKTPSITVNKNNEVFVVFQGIDPYISTSVNNIRKIKYNGSWGTVATITNNTSTTNGSTDVSALYDLSLDFSTPLFIYRDNQGNKVGFYGTWTSGSTVPILENDIRFTVKDTDEVVAWVERDELAGFTVDAQLNGQAMAKTSVTGEDQFTATLPSVQPAELRLTMTRANTADDVKISKILGGVA